jgi:uncharacterized protein
MTIGIDGIDAHAEDGWLGSHVRVGRAVVLLRGNVGRCAVTTLDPDRGVRDLETLDAIADYRAEVPTSERLPFGVWGEVVEPGRIEVGDAIEAMLDYRLFADAGRRSVLESPRHLPDERGHQ